MSEAQKILEKALRLPAKERQRIGRRLLESAPAGRTVREPVRKRASKPPRAPGVRAIKKALSRLADEAERVSPSAPYYPFGPPIVDED